MILHSPGFSPVALYHTSQFLLLAQPLLCYMTSKCWNTWWLVTNLYFPFCLYPTHKPSSMTLNSSHILMTINFISLVHIYFLISNCLFKSSNLISNRPLEITMSKAKFLMSPPPPHISAAHPTVFLMHPVAQTTVLGVILGSSLFLVLHFQSISNLFVLLVKEISSLYLQHHCPSPRHH